jgi:hypothetical protein
MLVTKLNERALANSVQLQSLGLWFRFSMVKQNVKRTSLETHQNLASMWCKELFRLGPSYLTLRFISRTVGILGAGLMGAGIAQVTLDKGIKTIMKDANDAGITRGIHQVQTGVDSKVKRKKISRYRQWVFMLF